MHGELLSSLSVAGEDDAVHVEHPSEDVGEGYALRRRRVANRDGGGLTASWSLALGSRLVREHHVGLYEDLLFVSK